MVPMRPSTAIDDNGTVEYEEDLPYEYESHRVEHVKGFLDYTNKLNEISAWYGSAGSEEVAVGLFATNNWGLYDVVGLMGEWTLDTALKQGGSALPRKGLGDNTDPTGVDLSAYGSAFRVFRTASANYAGVALYNIIPCSRQMKDPSDEYSCSTRFCIHLKPLVKEGRQP